MVACHPMSKQLDEIAPELAQWIVRQKVFFVATAPLSAAGHVNCSPKGGGSLQVLGPMEVAYQEWHGSGAETVAHLRENGRILIMLCAFDGEPNIVRLHGHGRVITPSDSDYSALSALFPPHPGTRSIIHVNVERVSESCGWGVPLMEFRAERNGLEKWARAKGETGLAEYRALKNAVSIDGLPAFGAPPPMLARPSTWDRVSSGYDAEVRPMFETFAAKALELAGVRAGMHIVDIAAGPGTLVALATETGAAVTAVDFSPAMIERLQRRQAEAGWAGVHAVVGNGMDLPHDDATFDAAFSMFGLMFFTDRARGFAEMHRVLRPGGTGVVSSWVPMSQVPVFSTTMALLSEALPDLLPAKPLPPVLNDADACRSEMAAAGFEDVQVIEHSTTFEAPDMETMVDSFLRTNAIVAHLAATTPDRWPLAEVHLRQGLAKMFGTGPQSMTMTALISAGKRPA